MRCTARARVALQRDWVYPFHQWLGTQATGARRWRDYSLTLGPNWTPTGNFLMRPAFRWDFSGGPDGGPRAPSDDGISNQQTMLGFDLIQKL